MLDCFIHTSFILVFILGILTTIKTYVRHISRLINKSEDKQIKGHIRQHMLLLNIFILFIVVDIIEVYNYSIINKTDILTTLFTYSFTLPMLILGIFLIVVSRHLIEELKKGHKW